jgi:hypothetical protein
MVAIGSMAGGVTGLCHCGWSRPTSARTSRTLFCDGHHMTKVLPALGSNASDGFNTIVGRRAAIGSRRTLKLAPTSGWPRSAGFSFRSPLPQGGPGSPCMDVEWNPPFCDSHDSGRSHCDGTLLSPAPAGLSFGTPSHLIIGLVTDGTPRRSDHRHRLAHLPAVAGIERQPRARAGQRGQSKC